MGGSNSWAYGNGTKARVKTSNSGQIASRTSSPEADQSSSVQEVHALARAPSEVDVDGVGSDVDDLVVRTTDDVDIGSPASFVNKHREMCVSLREKCTCAHLTSAKHRKSEVRWMMRNQQNVKNVAFWQRRYTIHKRLLHPSKGDVSTAYLVCGSGRALAGAVTVPTTCLDLETAIAARFSAQFRPCFLQ